ncbi:MAG TPA: ubiquinol-cytochrome c reductase cytochrome b subunit, partial [Jatrophihabitans sp.]|nr:ubiquinol-cytochrome c reductase cytochrome b subunit [Jatrophihabitans sp.]
MKIVRPLLRLTFSRRSLTGQAAGATGRALEERLNIAGGLRKQLDKAFPSNWSFMLGEIALYSFIVLVLTGTFLTFFFDPSMARVHYHGSYVPLQGVDMSRAYASSLDLSFDVRGGLLVRQVHHWAALVFTAAMIVHMCRIFFTGAFRKPRELNWLIGLTLLMLGIIEGFAGYSIPDDLLSGTGLRVAFSIVESIPVLGSWLAFLIWGGDYPGTEIIGRLYIAHVLLIPGLIAVLIGAHLSLIIRQKHTDFPAAGRTEQTVSGERLYPAYGMKSAGFFLILVAVLGALGGLAQINPVWLWGPYDPARQTSGAQPDWYIGFLEGSLRLFPPIEIHLFHHTISPIFWPTVALPVVLFAIAAAWPFLERRLSGDHEWHNLLQRPRDAPARTATGAMALSFWMVLNVAWADDMMADAFHLGMDAVVEFLRIATVVVPAIVFFFTYWMCL